jgi:phage baseplate assembly protein gpV
MAYYKEIDDLLKRRGKASGGGGGGCVGSGSVSGARKSPTSNTKIESYLQFTTDNGAPLPYDRDSHALLDEMMTRCVLNSTSEILTMQSLCFGYKPTILVYSSVNLCY